MKIFVTKEYFDKSERKVRELQERLAQIRSDKTATYTEDTNTWHDSAIGGRRHTATKGRI